jgi:exoribonuclease R
MRISINTRDYESWSLYNESNDLVATNADPVVYRDILNPIDQKLFHEDVLRIDIGNKTVERGSSSVREAAYITGVLLLENNKTFGRTETKKKLLYRCIPDDKHLPVFLIPYEVKAVFSKVHTNKYVLFKFNHWEDKHPRGLLTETIGDVSELPAYYEYRLYCKYIHTTLNGISRITNKMCSSSTEEKMLVDIQTKSAYQIENREDRRIISIDPTGSLDIDDAFGIEPVITMGTQTGWVLSIYIANVFIWIEYLQLWDSLSDRVSTVYLPDNKRPMLPAILSDNYCSLLQHKTRFAFTMDIPMDINGTIDAANVKLSNTSIRVFKNYSYTDSKLLKEPVYTTVLRLIKINNSTIQTSHDLVEYMMISMNTLTAKILMQNECGIFRKMAFERSPVLNNTSLPNANSETIRVMNSWNNVAGGYVNYSNQDDISHHLLNVNGVGANSTNQHYVHITSPIRRLVDLLNQITLSRAVSLIDSVSPDATRFLEKWLSNMETINANMKSTRKLQYECELLHKCTTDNSICNETHLGYIVDLREGHDYIYKYTVYLPGLKLFASVRSELAYAKYSDHQFSVFMFHDSDTIVKKIRLQLVKAVMDA